MKKKIWNGVFLVVVFVLTVWSVLHGENLAELTFYLQEADLRFVIPGILCVLLFIIGESVVIYYLMNTLGQSVCFSHCCLYSFIGFFYSCITPSASGGQPMQVIAMRKDRIPVAVSTVVLAIVTITYKLVLVMIGAVVLILRPQPLMIHLEPVETILYLGLALNVICIAGILLLVFQPGLVRRLGTRLLLFWNRIRPFRDLEKQMARLDRIADQYQGAADFYRSRNYVIIHVFGITLLQRCSLFLVTWLTYCAFHLSGESMPVVTGLQAMISVAADMLPFPGGMGISENLFLEIFQTVFGDELVLPAMVISRGISYYSQLLISAVMTVASAWLLAEKREKVRERTCA